MMNCSRGCSVCGSMRPNYPGDIKNSKLEMRQCVPVLYRFIEERYIDEFINEGKLMISTIPRCRNLENSKRNDKYEAVYGYNFIDEEGAHSLDAIVGENAFVLCTSLTQCAEHEKGYTWCLELHNVGKLVDEITNQLRQIGYDVCEVLSGPCNYAMKRREISLKRSGEKFSDLVMDIGDDGLLSVNNKKVNDVLRRLGVGAFYTTKDFGFVNEHEYRILWLCQSAVPRDPVFVWIQNPLLFGCKIPALDLKEIGYDG